MNSTMWRRIALLTTAVALVAAACGNGAEDASGASAVLPFELVQASELAFEVDPADTSRGIFRVTTTESMICAIAWGETEALGHQNNSLSMNGTGIVGHDVFLPGAEPGKTYYFRLQGSAADGQLYQSELAAFTLPEVEDGAAAGEGQTTLGNLATGATITDFSSEFPGPSWAAVNAIDGDLATEWSSAGDGDGGFIVLDLGSNQAVGGVEFITRSMADGSAITSEFTITVDGDEVFGPYPAGTPANPRFSEVILSGREIRFDISASTGGNTGAVEVRVYAAGE